MHTYKTIIMMITMIIVDHCHLVESFALNLSPYKPQMVSNFMPSDDNQHNIQYYEVDDGLYVLIKDFWELLVGREVREVGRRD